MRRLVIWLLARLRFGTFHTAYCSQSAAHPASCEQLVHVARPYDRQCQQLTRSHRHCCKAGVIMLSPVPHKVLQSVETSQRATVHHLSAGHYLELGGLLPAGRQGRQGRPASTLQPAVDAAGLHGTPGQHSTATAASAIDSTHMYCW